MSKSSLFFRMIVLNKGLWIFSLCFSVHRFCTSVKAEPCSTLFYLLLVVFGFVPFLCFFLFIGGAFILSVVWFAVCQGKGIIPFIFITNKPQIYSPICFTNHQLLSLLSQSPDHSLSFTFFPSCKGDATYCLKVGSICQCFTNFEEEFQMHCGQKYVF